MKRNETALIIHYSYCSIGSLCNGQLSRLAGSIPVDAGHGLTTKANNRNTLLKQSPQIDTIRGASIELLQESMFVDFCITVNSYTIKLKHKSIPSV